MRRRIMAAASALTAGLAVPLTVGAQPAQAAYTVGIKVPNYSINSTNVDHIWPSRVTISGFRSGSYVYLRAFVQRFSVQLAIYSTGYWQKSGNRYVRFYRYHGGWQQVAVAWTGSNGWTTYVRIYSPGHGYWRVHVDPTRTLSDGTSGPLSR